MLGREENGRGVDRATEREASFFLLDSGRSKYVFRKSVIIKLKGLFLNNELLNFIHGENFY